MGTYILAIDQGTTGSTVLLVDRDLSIRARGYREFRQIYPRPGEVEHDLDDIWHSVAGAAKDALAASGVDPREIAAVGITNQRETVAFWRRDDGTPLGRAMVWQDRRTAESCRELREAGHTAMVRERTGLVLDPYFSGTKIRWRLDREPDLRAACERGDARVGTIDSYLAWRLTNGAAHVTDVSNASRTLLFDIRRMAWDDDLLALMHTPPACLPRVVDNAEVYGHTRGLGFLPDGIPVSGMAGDQQAALFGQACFAPGEAKCTFGTGAFLLMNIGDAPRASNNGLLTTVGWKLGAARTYAFEGSAFIAGAAVQWLRDGLGIIQSAPEIEALAASVPDSGEVVFVPALAGLGAPHWRPEARGLVCGITRGTTRAHLARATLEGIALEVADLAAAMERDAGRPVTEMRVDGGAAANNLLMQMQADLLDRPVVRPRNVETTAFGAAFLAGLGAGLWSSPDEIRASFQEDRRFSARMDETARAALFARWHRAVERA